MKSSFYASTFCVGEAVARTFCTYYQSTKSVMVLGESNTLFGFELTFEVEYIGLDQQYFYFAYASDD